MNEYVSDYFLTAGECSPEGTIPVTLIANRLIEIATMHANQLGVGYERLLEDGTAWVLSRLSIEMLRWPEVNKPYSLRTWVEGYNRHFSERDFEITDSEGRVLGYARSVWMTINIRTRQGGQLNGLEKLGEVVSDRPCPIAKCPKLTAVDPSVAKVNEYTFRYTDCDFNRHVNTVRYIELLLDQWDLQFHDTHRMHRLDIAFMHESHFGEHVNVAVEPKEPGEYRCEINGDSGTCARASIIYNEII
ncbi:MAG: thioesterase [Muribaculum sp.]|nr:thioesterase [Muribaculum sp.]